jgi:hypothetical protein
MLRPYFVQNKYVPHTKSSRPPEDQQRPPGGGGPQFENIWFILYYHVRERTSWSSGYTPLKSGGPAIQIDFSLFSSVSAGKVH